MAYEGHADVRPVALQHPGTGADDRLHTLEIAELLDALARDDGHRDRVGEHVEEPGERLLERELHRVAIDGLDALDRAQHVGARIAGDGEEALDAVLDVVRRELAPVHRRLVVPAHAAAQLEDVRGLGRLRPRLREIGLDRERARHHRRARLVLHETAVREGERDLHAIRGRQHRIEERGIPAPERQRAAALRCLPARDGRHDRGPGHRERGHGKDVSTRHVHGGLRRWARRS